MRNLKLGFIGLGLIGGSIAKAAKKMNPDNYIVAYNRSEESRLLALQDKVADVVCDKVDSHFANLDYIFLCTPVEHNISYLETLKGIIQEDTIITDVGSVKGNIHKAVSNLHMEANFIGGHPMAGSEKTGYRHSNEKLLENAYYPITPTDEVNKDRIAEMYEFVKGLKAIPIIVDYKKHDYAVAGISHVPHLIASTLVNLVKDNDSEDELMKLLAAGGFKDITRIASSSPEMWEQICSTNRNNIVKLLTRYIAALEDIRCSLMTEEYSDVNDLFTKSCDYRNSFSTGKGHGPIRELYRIYCDLADESGAISKIAGLLAACNISIKNIGIVNNREFENGVLRIEFYEQDERDSAVNCLLSNGYTIYVND